MREIKLIILHCTATQQWATIESIKKYWKEKLGWKNPGYHYIITPDGVIHTLLPEKEISNGVEGENHHSINISYIGGVDESGKAKDNRTLGQINSQINLIKDLSERYANTKIAGHNQFTKLKACPSFNVPEWLRAIGISESKIYRTSTEAHEEC